MRSVYSQAGRWSFLTTMAMGFSFWLLSSQPVLAYAPIIPNDPLYSKQWALNQIDAPHAWSVSTGTHDVIVAVVDTGVDITHPDLAPNIWTNPGEIPGNGIDDDHDGYVDDVHGWNFINNTSDVMPMASVGQVEEAWDHGTLVSSLIGARGNDGRGMSGVTWNVQIMPLVVLDGDGFGSSQSIEQAVHFAVTHGANIINMSLAGYEEDPALYDAIKEAYDAGVLVVAATGNDDVFTSGVDLDQTPAYPACADGDANRVLGVGGTDPLDQRSPYANYGTSCMDLVAPSLQLIGARPSIPFQESTSTSLYVEGLSGTSLAAPLVTGAAALIKSVNPEWKASQIRDWLLSTADPVNFQNLADGKASLPTKRLNIGRALMLLQPHMASDVPVTRMMSSSTMTTLSWQAGVESLTDRVRAPALASFWREDPMMGWEAQVVYQDAKSGKYFVHVWRPQAHETKDYPLELDRKVKWQAVTVRARGAVKGFVFSSSKSPVLFTWNVDTRSMSQKRLYGSKYSAGLQAFLTPDQDQVIVWPTRGGGQAVTVDALGAVLRQSFPLGKDLVGGWTLRSDRAGLHAIDPKGKKQDVSWDLVTKKM